MGWSAAKAVAAGRVFSGHTQKTLAEKLTAVSGEDWNRDKVASLESGRRTFDVDTLRYIAQVQGLPYSWYLDPDRHGLVSENDPGSLSIDEVIARMERVNSKSFQPVWVELEAFAS